MAYDLFNTRTMLQALEQRYPARTFFLKMFFSVMNVADTDTIDIDIWKGKRRLAPFVNPRLQGKVVEKLSYKTLSYKPPYVKPKMVTTAADILERPAGSTIYTANQSPAQRASLEVGKNIGTLDDMITRREEWMAASVLTTGKIVVQGDGVDDEIDFLMEPSHLPTLSGGALWTAHTTATPIADLRTWKKLVSKDSGLVPTDCIMGSTAYENFMQCEEVIGTSGGKKGLFDLRRVDVGQIVPREQPDGVTYIGTITELGLDIWTYDEYYVDEISENDEERSMMPENKVLMGSTRAYCRRQYGAIKDLKATAAVPRFPKTWEEDDPSARYLMLQSSPLPSMHQVDAFLCAEVTV